MNTGYRIVLGLTGAALAASITYAQVGGTTRGEDPSRRIRSIDVGENDAQLDHRVTKSFSNTDAKEVLDWLAAQGVSFVVKDADIEGTKLTVNFDNVTLRDASRSIARALGGHLERQGTVYVFHRGLSMIPLGAGDFKSFSGEGFNLPPMAFEGGNGKNWDEFGKNMEKFGEQFAKQWTENKDWQKFGEGFNNKEWQNYGKSFNNGDWKQYGEQMKSWAEKLKAEMKAEGIKDNQKMTPEQEKRFHERMKSMPMPPMPAIPPMPPMPSMRGMDPGTMKQFEEQMRSMPPMNQEEMRKLRDELKSLKGDPLSRQDMKRLREELRAENGMRGQGMKDLQMKLKEMRNLKGVRDGEQPDKELLMRDFKSGRMRMDMQNLKKLLKSLTPGQREIQKKKGYLTPADLTPSQRELIKGMLGEGNSSFSFVIDKDKLNLKSK